MIFSAPWHYQYRTYFSIRFNESICWFIIEFVGTHLLGRQETDIKWVIFTKGLIPFHLWARKYDQSCFVEISLLLLDKMFFMLKDSHWKWHYLSMECQYVVNKFWWVPWMVNYVYLAQEKPIATLIWHQWKTDRMQHWIYSLHQNRQNTALDPFPTSKQT